MQFEISEHYYGILQACLHHFALKNLVPQDRIEHLQSKLKEQHDNDNTNEIAVIIEISEREYKFLQAVLNNQIKMVRRQENSIIELRSLLRFRHDFSSLFSNQKDTE